MVKFTSTQYASMTNELNNIASEALNILQQSERSYAVVRVVLNEIKSFILDYHFKDQQEEIRFFKEIKPQFMRELIYYEELYEIEARKPVGGKEQFVQYYEQEVERIRQYFVRHQVLYNYYRTDKSDYDELFFTRANNSKSNTAGNPMEIDNRICTAHSYRLSKLQGFEMVNDYLQQCIFKLNNPEFYAPSGTEQKFTSLWTDSKAALIELAYALQARGSVNNGKGDLNKIISDLELVFNIRLGNFYRVYQSIRMRKKNRTIFLDGLKESLEKDMDDADEL